MKVVNIKEKVSYLIEKVEEIKELNVKINEIKIIYDKALRELNERKQKDRAYKPLGESRGSRGMEKVL